MLWIHPGDLFRNGIPAVVDGKFKDYISFVFLKPLFMTVKNALGFYSIFFFGVLLLYLASQ